MARKNKNKPPKMWIKCGHCGRTLGHATKNRNPETGFNYDSAWGPGGLVIRVEGAGNKFKRDSYGRDHVYHFDCAYDVQGTGAYVAKVDEKPDELDKMDAADQIRGLAKFKLEQESARTGRPFDELAAEYIERTSLNEAKKRARQVNPARFTEAGTMPSPREERRAARRGCGRHYSVKGNTIVEKWAELAGVAPGMDPKAEFEQERKAFLQSRRYWEMTL